MAFEFKDPFSGFSVDDTDAAERFYSEVLGISVERNDMGILTLDLGSSHAIAYPKPGHVPATFTVLNFPVKDIDKAVAELADKGVEFDRYPELGATESGVHHNSGPLIAWFKDPAGNVFSLIED